MDALGAKRPFHPSHNSLGQVVFEPLLTRTSIFILKMERRKYGAKQKIARNAQEQIAL